MVICNLNGIYLILMQSVHYSSVMFMKYISFVCFNDNFCIKLRQLLSVAWVTSLLGVSIYCVNEPTQHD